MNSKKKIVEVLTVIHLGNYSEAGAVINDACPCCGWEPTQHTEASPSRTEEPEWYLGEIWNPGVERRISAYFQVFHCQSCGLVYATHLN